MLKSFQIKISYQILPLNTNLDLQDIFKFK
jgi:hypothetical protein